MIDDINAWRKSNLGSLTAHDTLHLFSGLDFEALTIGLANQYTSWRISPSAIRVNIARNRRQVGGLLFKMDTAISDRLIIAASLE